MAFKHLKDALQNQFAEMCKDQNKLFTVQVDRDKIWDIYLNGFSDPVIKQDHNCNCCKSFLRQFSGIVVIKGNRMVSMWDITPVEGYENSQKMVQDYIHSLPISDVFLNTFPGLGTDMNTQTLPTGNIVQWNHFHLKLDKKFVFKSNESPESAQGTMRDNKTVLQRSLSELNIDASETVLELIAQNSLYRGKEFENMVTELYNLQKLYKDIPTQLKDNFCWIKSTEIGQNISRIRNTSIGTLLIDLSAGVELDTAVRSFERVVAPSNYKRPTAITTPKMVEEAKKRLEELGLMNSLERRYATQSDLNVNDILYTDKSTSVKDVFDEMSKETIVNPKTLSKVEEVTMDEFISNVLPKAKSLELLLENKHCSNLVSLIAPINDSPTMFKWDNAFSWSYTGGITDSIKENVKSAGGSVEGILRFSLQWNENKKDTVDLDAHCISPYGHIYYSSKMGYLDVDMIRPSGIGIENIVFKSVKNGTYKFRVHNFDSGRHSGFKCQLEVNGEVYEFAYPKHQTGYVDIADVTVKDGVFTVKQHLDGSSNVTSKKVWGVNTNHFQRVKTVMLSPNYWGNKSTGNKHYMFMLEGAVSDETPRPFFNEFLKEDLLKEKRVFETLAGKLRVEASPNQLSGVGFSETQRNSVYMRVEGAFKRIVKINL